VKVLLRNPRRELDLPGPLRVHALLDKLALNRESVLVIRGDTLVTGDALLDDADVVEVRPVISGGCGETARRGVGAPRSGGGRVGAPAGEAAQ